MEPFLTELYAAGLTELWTTVQTNWIQPLFLAAVAVFALMLAKDKAWMKLISFVGIAAVVGVLIFAGDSLFGKDGNLTTTAGTLAGQVKEGSASSNKESKN